MRQRPGAALALLALGVAACGPKLDPLHPLKAELSEARRDGPRGTPPHVRATLATSTLTGLVRSTISDPERPISVPVMLGTSAVVMPALDPPTLDIGRSQACDCARVQLDVSGSVDIELRGLLGRQKLAEGLGFAAQATGTAQLSVDRIADTGEKIVALEPVPADPWDIRITLDNPKGMVNDDLVRNQVSRPLVEALSKPVTLAKLPPTLPVQPARIDLEVASDPTAALWLRGRPADAAPSIEVAEGWGIATTESAVTAGARAAFAVFEQPKRWKLEPLAVRVDDGTWEADVRLHKVARRAKYRDYTLHGTLTIGESIAIAPDSAVRTAKAGWGGSLVAPFIDGRFRKQAEKLELEIPVSTEQKLGQSAYTLTVERITSTGPEVFVYGSIEPGPRADAPLPPTE
ncbi:MAG: hypothetical protein R3F61_18990 [Myxococcota bacterium]